MKALILNGSPRRNGNSVMLSQAVEKGLLESGYDVETVFADEVVKSFLRDCRHCRNADGKCAIVDGFEDVFLRSFLSADGIIFSTPIYWYGMAAQLKAFFDRIFCYVAASYPDSERIVREISGKRIGAVISSEETFPTVAAGISHQLQEYSRYTRSEFIGLVQGIGNSRQEVQKDPSMPIDKAIQLGRYFFKMHASDYQIDTPRSGKVWG